VRSTEWSETASAATAFLLFARVPRPPRFGAAKKNGRRRRAEDEDGGREDRRRSEGRAFSPAFRRNVHRSAGSWTAASRPRPFRRDPAATALRAASSGEEQKSPVRGRARRESGGQWPEPGLFGVAAHSGREVLPDGKTTRPRAPGVEGRRGAGAPSRGHVPSGASAPRGRDVASGPSIWSIPTRGRAWRFARGSRDTASFELRDFRRRPTTDAESGRATRDRFSSRATGRLPPTTRRRTRPPEGSG